MHRFFIICAVFHCTVSVLMTLNTIYVIFKSVIPFYVQSAFKFLTFYFNFFVDFRSLPLFKIQGAHSREDS